MKLTYYGRVDESGNITLPRQMRREIKTAFPDSRIKVTVEKRKYVRSLSQNAYYWIILAFLLQYFVDVDPIGNSGLTTDDIHDFFKRRFLPKRYVTLNTNTGEAVQLTPTTTTLTKSEFSDYLEKIMKFGIEFLNVSEYPKTEEYIAV